MPSDSPPASRAFERAVRVRGTLYALVDAARDCDGPFEAAESGLRHQSLFAGDLGAALADVAPYLVEVRARTSFYTWFFEQFGNSVGVLFESTADFDILRRHFRTLLQVRDDARKRYYFRFYDPRVLRVFLPACTPDEARRFFGPIQTFCCEGDGGGELLIFALTTDGVSSQRSPIDESAPG